MSGYIASTSQKKSHKITKEIEDIRDKFIEDISPERIYLFGSYADVLNVYATQARYPNELDPEDRKQKKHFAMLKKSWNGLKMK